MQHAIAALSIAINAALDKQHSRIQLLPFGQFRADNDAGDKRPADAPYWLLDEQNGFTIADMINTKATQTVIDYEHQTLHSPENGQPAPAAGWITSVEFVPGAGLFAEVDWTPAAAKMIKDGEYRYISPVFTYDDYTSGTPGRVTQLLHAALTNNPALDGMQEVTAAASARFLNNESQHMNVLDLLKQLFDLPTATEEQITAALSALLKAKPKSMALSAVFTEITKRDQQIAALSANPPVTPDLSQFVPVSVMQQLQTQVAALTTQINQDKAGQLIEHALTEGKLLPAQKSWAQDLAGTPQGLAQLSTYLGTVPAVTALNTQQTTIRGVEKCQKTVALSAEQKAAAKMLGMSEKEMTATLNEETQKD